jgi:hypothetical protein
MKDINENLRLGVIFVTVIVLTVMIYFGSQAVNVMKDKRDRSQANAFLLNAHDLQILCFRKILPEDTTEPSIVLGVRYISLPDFDDPSSEVLAGLSAYPYKIGVYSDYKPGLYGGTLPLKGSQQLGEADKEGSLYFIKFKAITKNGIEVEIGRISGSLDGVGETFIAIKNKDGTWELEGTGSQWISSNKKGEPSAGENASRPTA